MVSPNPCLGRGGEGVETGYEFLDNISLIDYEILISVESWSDVGRVPGRSSSSFQAVTRVAYTPALARVVQ